MAESKEDSSMEGDLSRDLKKVSFADPAPASPSPPTTSISASASAPAPAPAAVSFVDKGWPDQEAAGIEYGSLTPLSPVVMHRQATINIGTIGHVAHGKSTVVKAISGVQTVRFKTELERNITIKLGYANAKIYRCNNTKCPRPGNYKSYGSAAEASPMCQREGCGGTMELQRHVSFVDCFAPHTRVRMADGGVKRVDQLSVGDGMMGPDGSVRTVVGSVVSGVKEMYELEYGQKGDDDERRSFSCTGGHLLVLRIDEPVDTPFFQSSNESYAVRVLSADTAGIESNLHTFATETDATEFYSQCDHSAIEFEMTVDSYRIAPSYITDKARLFYCPPFPTLVSSTLSPPLPSKSLHSTSRPFTVASVGPQPFFGFETDGDQRVLLDDGLVVHNCPGHDILMATMLNGAAVMDAAMLLIAGNEPCPQPQTSEHLAAVEIMKLKHLLILQNKIDLVKEKEAASQYDEILNFIRGTVADGSPIIPISAQLKYNIDVACEYICKKIPVPVRDFSASPQLIVIRSFDVNKPGEEVDNLKGGVAGGSILKGVLRIGQEIEIRPGIVTKDKTGGVRCLPIKSRIVSLYAEHNDLHFAVPGGLIGVGTKIDPTLTRADRLVGQVLGDIGALPDIFTELEISFFLLRRLLGVKTDGEKKKAEKIKKLMKGEILMVNIGSTSTGARILQVKGDLAKVVLTSPVCTSEGEKLALSRRVEKHWRLIGWGKIRKGTKIVASDTAGSGGTSGLGVGVGVAGDEGGVDEMDELSKEADRAGEGEQEDEDEDEEEKD